jgi:hypothetical protein
MHEEPPGNGALVAMPWFPEFTSALERERGERRAEGQADPVGQCVAALTDADTRAWETVWPGRVVVDDPRDGEVRGRRHLRQFVRRSHDWLAERHARVEAVASTSRAAGPWRSCWRTWALTDRIWSGRSLSSLSR